MASSKGPGFYEFLIEAELQQYYAGFKNDLKIQNVPQLKYVTEEDLHSIGMSKPEMRRLKKYFQRHYPQNYLSKFKKLILSKREEPNDSILSIANEPPEKPAIKVPNKHIIAADAIIVNKELGQGEFGVVQQGVWTDEDDRIQVAIKCLSRERMQNNPIEFLKEAAIMHGIDHEHIVRLYGVVLDTNSLMLVTELAPLRSLLECLKEPSLRSSFPVLSLCDFAIQVCDGMQYLEQKRLIHRDLAARNILVFSKNKVKISDFGLSRALGVGKDYYQTNFNVNLKLPIAWCAPECISYLRFTSASDVWAYGVTLWEMFSYGFQPWAALTGHQILEAIDEPNFQRLEQPECCPREYYNIMLKCWQHDPNKRPRFSDLINILPECKPEQVQTVQEFVEDVTKSKRDQLVYRVGDIITVLDKQNPTNCWKGVLNSGKTGLFNPAHTVTYLGNNLPSNKMELTRGDGKNVYSSKRKIRPDMISGPQGDLKHTGHVGLDGAYFGDLSFLGGKNPNLPRQIVTPYKPHEDSSSCETDSKAGLSRTCSDVSDCTPLLTTPQNDSVWAEAMKLNDHEYHEISDDEELAGSPVFKKSFDYGPSLMDEMESVFRSLGGSPVPPPSTERKKPPPPFTLTPTPSVATPPASPLAEAINVKNELKEMAAKAASRRKQATVKPISAADEKTLDSAIAMANELTAKSMNDLDGGTPPESPHTPVSPTKRKFSFRFPSVPKHSSPKVERKNFAEQTACIPDIQESLSAEAKEVYNSLVEQPVIEAQSILPAQATLTRISHPQFYVRQQPPPNLSTFGHPQPPINRSESISSANSTLSDNSESNPLRMLRSGAFPMVRPRGRVAKADSHQKNLPKIKVPPPPTAPPPVPIQRVEKSQQESQPYSSHVNKQSGAEETDGGIAEESWRKESTSSQNSVDKWRKESVSSLNSEERWRKGSTTSQNSEDKWRKDSVTSCQSQVSEDENPIPLPPRDRSRPVVAKPRHQRKHPLVIPGLDMSNLTVEDQEVFLSSVPNITMSIGSHDASLPPLHPNSHTTAVKTNDMDDSFEQQIATELDALDDLNVDQEHQEEMTNNFVDFDRGQQSSQVPFSSSQIRHDDNPPQRTLLFEDDVVRNVKPSIHLRQTIAHLNQNAAFYTQPDEFFESQRRDRTSTSSKVHSIDLDEHDIEFVDADDIAELRRHDDHVSCEDLVEFSNRTKSKSRGRDSDEVRIMSKVLGKEVTSEDCLYALNATNWEVHSAIKLAKLRNLLKSTGNFRDLNTCWETLSSCEGDVAKAASMLIAASEGLSAAFV